MDKIIENIIVYNNGEIELNKNPTVKKYLTVQKDTLMAYESKESLRIICKNNITKYNGTVK